MYSFISDYELREIRAFHIHSKGQKSMYPPQSSQKAHTLANYMKFANHFLIWTTRNGNPEFYSELREICSIRQPTQQITWH